MSKTIAIGDLHGHHDQLLDLLDKLRRDHGIDFKKDVLVFLGDYVDGGSQSKQVLDELMILKEEFPHFQMLFGNHESLLLDAFNPKHPIYGSYELWYRQGGKATLESFIPPQSMRFSNYEKAIVKPKKLITKEYLDFMSSLPIFYETDNYFFVHGGVYPDRELEDHEKALDGITPKNMTEGDIAYNMIWMRDPFIGSDYNWCKKIIFGHTTFPYYSYMSRDPVSGKLFSDPGHPFIMDNKIGIDGMWLNDGRLMAVILPDEEFVYSYRT